MLAVLSLCLCLSLPQSSTAAESKPPVIIDMHAHAFNARYLPICGILEANGVPPYLAIFLQEFFYTNANLTDFETSDLGIQGREEIAKLLEPLNQDQQLMATSEESELWPALGELYQDEELTRFRKWRIRRYLKKQENPKLLEDLDGETSDQVYVQTFMKGAPLLREKESASNLKGLAMFARIALQEEQKIVDQMKREIDAQLFVHHMMDMDFVYGAYGAQDFQKFLDRGSTEKWHGMIPFEQQIERVEALGKQNSNLLYFVAFDPFRRKKDEQLDLDDIQWGEGERWQIPKEMPPNLPESMRLVHKALRGTAMGVKFYPPSGYRPAGNDDVPKVKFFRKKPPWFFPTVYSAQRHQYKTRYKHRNPETLDAVNRALFEYCAKYDIPIFSHHTKQGVESYDEYGELMGDPALWKPLLDGDFKKLRLCIGHSGGGRGWSAGAEEEWDDSFDKQAYKLAINYENVYIDFGDSEWILEEGKANNFKHRLVKLLKMDDQGHHKFKLREKIIFGSDWYMITRLKGLNPSRSIYLDTFIQLFNDIKGSFEESAWVKLRNDFFAGNAANFMNLDAYLKKENLPHETRAYLQQILDQLE